MKKSIILNFHNEENGALFEKIILALKARYRLVSIEELARLLQAKKIPCNICHITFDDGERSFYTTIFPVLQKHNVPVSLFVSPAIISGNKNFWFQEIQGYDQSILKNIIAAKLQVQPEKLAPYTCQQLFKNLTYAEIADIIGTYQAQTGCGIKKPFSMSVAEIKEVEASGLVTIGAHTINHPILSNESDERSRYEITSSIQQLAEMLGHPIRYFAYPNGRPGMDFGEREMQYLEGNNIALAFSTGLNTLTENINPLNIPRMGFARMGLSPSNPLIYFRLSLGSRWFNIRSIFTPSEQRIRQKIAALLNR